MGDKPGVGLSVPHQTSFLLACKLTGLYTVSILAPGIDRPQTLNSVHKSLARSQIIIIIRWAIFLDETVHGIQVDQDGEANEQTISV